MALEPEGNGEICSVTGTEANARFQDGLGWAWYGSRHDMSRMVDVSGRYDGPVCDDVLDAAIAAGEIHVYAYADGGDVRAKDLPVEAYATVFASAAVRQARLIAEPPKRTSVTFRSTSYLDGDAHGAPRWLAPVARLTGPGSVADVDYAGCLWALTRLAAGGTVEAEAAKQAGIELHAFAVSAEEDEEAMDRMILVQVEDGRQA